MFGLLSKKPVDKLIEVLGREKVSTSLVERKLYSYDATPIPIERACFIHRTHLPLSIPP
jgi:glycolate oxidase